MKDVRFPRLSEKEPEAEGVMSTWFVDEGASVAAGDLIGEVMVEKVSGEVRAPAGGRIHLTVSEDDVVRQGSVIATIAELAPS